MDNTTITSPKLGLTRDRLLEAGTAAGHDVKAVRNAMFALYENGYITYPYTDCEFLPAVQAQEAPSVVAAIATVTPELDVGVTVNTIAPVFIADFVWPHHAIVPCEKNTLWAASIDDVAPLARETYLLIATAYLAAISA